MRGGGKTEWGLAPSVPSLLWRPLVRPGLPAPHGRGEWGGAAGCWAPLPTPTNYTF